MYQYFKDLITERITKTEKKTLCIAQGKQKTKQYMKIKKSKRT